MLLADTGRKSTIMVQVNHSNIPFQNMDFHFYLTYFGLSQCFVATSVNKWENDDRFLTLTWTQTDGNTGQSYTAICKQAFSVCTRHYVSKRNLSSETAFKHETDECDCSTAFSLHFKLLRASPFPTLATDVRVHACYRGIGSPCLSRAAFSFSTLILALRSSSSSSCFLFSPSLFSSRYTATFLWLATTNSCSSLAKCRGRNLLGSWWG